MTQRYVEMTRAEVEAVLVEQMGFHEVTPDEMWERVYSRPVVTNSGVKYPYEIRVYSSVDRRSDVTRACGKDAIRVVLFDAITGRPYKKAERRVFRMMNALNNLRSRCREVFKVALEGPHCPKCNALMIEREGGPSKRKFWGCSHYAPGRAYHCTGTREVA